jgi:RHS repeat-associated protein
VLAESDLSGNITSEYALFNRQRIARRDVSSGNVYYLFHDRLGSYRTLTDSTGHVQGESDYYPFGAERVVSSTVTDNFRFAGMEWDSEDGLNHTLYRQYTPAQCRWETPDPVRGCVNFPQGQNLYAYVKDNPTNAVDPRGDQDCSGGFESSDDPCTCCAEDYSFWSQNTNGCCYACGDCSPPAGGVGGGGGAGNPPAPVVCNCLLMAGTIRVLGCSYACICAGSPRPITFNKRCEWHDPEAHKLCPIKVKVVNVTPGSPVILVVITDPPTFCLGTPRNPPKRPPRRQ